MWHSHSGTPVETHFMSERTRTPEKSTAVLSLPAYDAGIRNKKDTHLHMSYNHVQSQAHPLLIWGFHVSGHKCLKTVESQGVRDHVIILIIIITALIYKTFEVKEGVISF